MLKKLSYIFIGLLIGTTGSIIFLNKDFLNISSHIWDFINASILLITALIVLFYTKETYLLRKHTANQNKPLIHWLSERINQKKNPIIQEHHGYHDERRPFIIINI